MRIITLLITVSALLLGCDRQPANSGQPVTPKSKSLGNAASTSQPAEDKLLAKIRSIVQPWQQVDPKWLSQSTLIVRAMHGSSTYPCVRMPGGGLDMPLRYFFYVQQVFKGKVALKEIDFYPPQHSPGMFPSSDADFQIGRTYLVFLRPSAGSMKQLLDPEGYFTMYSALHDDEIVAVIDLTISKEEMAALNVEATKEARHEGFTFTPEFWKSFREAPTVDYKKEQQLVKFLRDVVLAKGANFRSVREYLGRPSRYYRQPGRIVYEYYLNEGVQKNATDKTITAELEISFGQDLAVKEAGLKYYRHEVSNEGNRVLNCIVEVPQEELVKQGLSKFTIEWP